MQRTSSLPMMPPAGARHASWLELFFDLVAVAGVAQLARLLQGGPDARDVAVYAVLFAAFWTAWISNTLYGDVAAEKTRTRTLLLGMFGLTVMAAAVHGVQEGEHARAFALAYVVARLFANRVWQQRHQRVEGWPAARLTVGVAPWIASLWAVEERARLWLCTVGLLLDLVITLAVPVGRRIRHGVPAPRRPPSRQHHGAAGPVPVTTAHLDNEHLAERLGLFILIVLGEGVYQLVEAASDTPWDRDLHLTAPAAFLTLTLLWSLCLRRGHGGVPFLPPGTPVSAAVLALHCCTAAALAALAAGLGGVVAGLDGPLHEQSSWVMAAGAGAYVVIAASVRARTAPRAGRWLLVGVLPALALGAVVAATADSESAVRQVWLITAFIAWLSAAELLVRRRRATADAADGSGA
ncbi:low temperature requirement protein A [Streptomyces longwoodensis]|uniref:low temperature requirement protein A n=1 Tax=Streptomyces longwoodensis TaxID=68231 RepID=UPI002E8213D1|nr:low temperature requirement protein A [Streptomyces longwoodensis]WUC56223.1 low temperature requirement protein A [Streptomyces longwoodensis]